MLVQYCPVCQSEELGITGTDVDGNTSAECAECSAFFTLHKPKLEWIDVTRECKLEWYPLGGTVMIAVKHNHHSVALVGLGDYDLMGAYSDEYKLERGVKSVNCGWWFQIFKLAT